MEEYVDILDDKGQKTGRVVTKREAHKSGLFHPTVLIWFFTRDGRILLQQRGENKETFPLLWDVSVAGHISAGEEVLDAALREIEEEIGLELNADQLIPLGQFKSVQEHREDLVDKEFHNSFLCQLEVPFSALRKQDSEVMALKLMPLTTFAEEVWGLARPEIYVPHKASYYKAVIQEIQARLQDVSGEGLRLV
ncbi:MAG: NUDIX domain-containing protein [Flavobacteriaceae bacterium]|nr:NUDIX domain-containing protein [Eudoraea sp.]NNJ38645.1 NUDIX domain-containing protein [Flavobacteriaceae bacterium]